MKKRVLLTGLFLAFAVLFLTKPVTASAYAYEIKSYQVNIKVTSHNVYEIEENLSVHFNQSRHGIYRNIPVVNRVERTDGSKNTIHARIQNIRCSDDFSVSREGDNCQIKIGDEDTSITGEKQYYISYSYDMGNDVLEGNDEFYFNVIGTEWDTTIQNVSFRIEMPKEFDEEKLGMSYGGRGSTHTDKLSYYCEGNSIVGMLDREVTLRPYQGITVRLTLPEGYFESTSETPWMAYVSIILAFVAMAVAFFLWWIYGRDDPVIETVEFHAPDGLNSVELAFAYKGELSSQDVVSLIVYLAEKGYIEIHEGTDKNPKKGFTLIKKKDYQGTNLAEQIFMQGLFSSGSVVTKKDLENSFYKTINRIAGVVNNRKNKEKIFYANSINKGWILWLAALVPCLIAGFMPIYEYLYSYLFAIGLPIGVGILFLLAYTVLFHQGKWPTRIICFIVFAIIGIVVFATFMGDALIFNNEWYMGAYLFALVAGGVVMFFNNYLSKRTEYGTEILGRIRGFKNFLETAEKDRLEMLVSENPKYFYEILPYTYVLDVSNKWMKKFESIATEPPEWYHSHHNTMFDMMMFNQFMRSTMTTATSAMTSTPSSSGGGFSGGGSGGGGGGSW
ncbi:MAG: DUF2207 domain-containing protein [Lachnospiraceae bacterium]|nr:DUF2207 domain-containing protein [Lachnospiraceae bacterium]